MAIRIFRWMGVLALAMSLMPSAPAATVVSNGHTIAFNTTAGTYSIDGGGAVSGAIDWKGCTFTFSGLDIQAGALVTMTGTNRILLVSSGDLSIGTTNIVLSGGDASGAAAGVGKIGGYSGGISNGMAGVTNGGGPGGGTYPGDGKGGNGAGYGGQGGLGYLAVSGAGPTNGDQAVRVFRGGSGGSVGYCGGQAAGGGAGGGGITLLASGNITITGAIRAEGGAGAYQAYVGGGGGSGGAIILRSDQSITIDSGALLSVKGGKGGNADGGTWKPGGGGGGGGRIAIFGTNLTIAGVTQSVGFLSGLTQLSATGGVGGTASAMNGYPGTNGTIFYSLVQGSNYAFDTTAATLSINGGPPSNGTIDGSNVCNFTFSEIFMSLYDSVQIAGTNPIALISQEGITLSTLIDITGFAGAQFAGGTGRVGGWNGGGGGSQALATNGYGPGLGRIGSDQGGGGAGHAGAGGAGAVSAGNGGPAYGDPTNTLLRGGSGGGGSWDSGGPAWAGGSGGAGGGAIRFIARRDITVSGTIKGWGGKGWNGNYAGGGGGSGGAVVLETRGFVTITNSALIDVKGGNGGNGGTTAGSRTGGGGGSGGRVFIYARGCTVSGTALTEGLQTASAQLTAAGGSGGTATFNGSPGSDGTILFKTFIIPPGTILSIQ